MIFASRIAKIGKAKNINCNQISSSPLTFNVYLSNNNVQLKTLTVKDGSYILSKPQKNSNYTEVKGISNNFIIARNSNCFSLIRVDNGT